jgi:hypothetical protein
MHIHYEGKWEGVVPWKSRVFAGPVKWHRADRASAIWGPMELEKAKINVRNAVARAILSAAAARLLLPVYNASSTADATTHLQVLLL